MIDRSAVPFVVVDDVLGSHVPAGGGQFIETAGKVTGLTHRCACGCGAVRALVFGTGGWAFNGDRARPSVTPAFRCTGGCSWSGELVDGEFRQTV